MTVSIKVGDYLRMYGSSCEVVLVGETHGGITHLVTTNASLGLMYRSLDLNRAGPGDSLQYGPPSDPVFTTDNCISLESVITSLGECKFGTITDMSTVLMDSQINYVFDEAKYKDRTTILDFLDSYRSSLKGSMPRTSIIRTLLDVFKPFKSEIRRGNIALTRTMKDHKANREVSMKPGRAFRFMLPDLHDNDISLLAEAWIERTQPRKLTVHTGDKALDFYHVYSAARVEYRNPSTTCQRKSLATSCSHGTYRGPYAGGNNVSVAEPYASGDFFAVWVEDDEGLLAGRVVVGITNDGLRHAPLYGACEQSLDAMQSFLDKIGSSPDREDWRGLKLVLIGCQSEPVSPYLDGGYGGDISHDNYIVLTGGGCGDLSFEGTDGYPTHSHYCESCCDSAHIDEMYSDEQGSFFCDSCFNELYVILSDGEVCSVDDVIEVYHMGTYRTQSSMVHIEDESTVWCELVEEHWFMDDVTFSKDGDAVPTHLVKDYPDLFPVEEEEEEAA